jgi:hypothetical protein
LNNLGRCHLHWMISLAGYSAPKVHRVCTRTGRGSRCSSSGENRWNQRARKIGTLTIQMTEALWLVRGASAQCHALPKTEKARRALSPYCDDLSSPRPSDNSRGEQLLSVVAITAE